ncbi:MAG TPA: Smr/MutS family protein [Gemmatimonadaceae bacterium]|nr:Smr/MutS family protein [Gemmatimonadaceae bacterium]
MRSGKAPLANVWKAFDEAHFGAKNSLNLRDSLPSAADATFRTEAWLRERQVSGAKEVLIITGRGNQSPGGVSRVRATILDMLPTLRRRGVVKDWGEHSPGSLVVTLEPISSLLNAPRRKRDRASVEHVPIDPQALTALDSTTLKLLRLLAIRSLESLGVRNPEKFVEAEMLAKFSSLAASIPSGEGSEGRLRTAISAALEQLDE